MAAYQSFFLNGWGAGGPVTADLTATESGDTLSSVAVLAVQASATITEASDTLSSAAVLAITANSTLAESGDALAATAALAIQASLTATEDNDTLSGSSAIAVQGSLMTTEADDTVTSTASISFAHVETPVAWGRGSQKRHKRRWKTVRETIEEIRSEREARMAESAMEEQATELMPPVVNIAMDIREPRILDTNHDDRVASNTHEILRKHRVRAATMLLMP